MRYAAPLALTIAAACSLIGNLRAADDAKTELEGVWEQTALTVDGEVKPVAKSQMIIRGQTSTLMTDGKVVFTSKFVIDPSKTPKTMDGEYVSGMNAGKKTLGIYKLDGDKVHFCRGPLGGVRPKDFTSEKGSGNLVSEYKRVKP